MMKQQQRLHKYLAHAGLGSRRTIETWIKEGKITVDGIVASIGQCVSETSQIHFNGKRILLEQCLPTETSVILYHKPEGEICSRVSDGKNTVFDSLPPLKQGKWVMVGRLDVNTAGLLLFTTDGELAHRLMHPRFQVEREYTVRVLGQVDEAILSRLCRGVKLKEGMAKFTRIVPQARKEGVNQWYNVTLTEGRYREVRRLWESQGCTVSRLIRIRYGTIRLPRDLKKGHWQALNNPVFNI